VLYVVCAYVEKTALVLDWNEGALRAIVVRNLERLGQRVEGLDAPLDAYVPED
jgi:hypothetical protein